MKPFKPVLLDRYSWDESEHPRGQPENKGQFVKSEAKVMYRGTRNADLNFYPGICFTGSESSAGAYGDSVHEVQIDPSKLSIKKVEMSDQELREAIDNQEWPCDRKKDIDQAIKDGFDAVEYTDCDERGQTHDCLRVLTQEAFDKSVQK